MHQIFENLELDWATLNGPSALPGVIHRATGQGKATLFTLRLEHLNAPQSLIELHEDAVARGLLPNSEHSLIGFFATAALCLRLGENPPVLFRYLITRRRLPATLEDEDTGYSNLKYHRQAERSEKSFLRIRSTNPGTPSGISRPLDNPLA